METELLNKLQDERKKVNTNPTELQKKAENYKMGHIRVMGMDITIENPKGSYRRGKDKNGKEWSIKMNNDYGYFKCSVGKDGDAVDVFLGPNLSSDKIFPIDQFIGGKYDETKVMLGFDTAEEAKEAYLSNYSKDWKGFKYITEVDVKTFKEWLYNGRRQRKPFHDYAWLKESETMDTKKQTGKRVYLSETQFKNYCRYLLREKRKEEYVKKLMLEMKANSGK